MGSDSSNDDANNNNNDDDVVSNNDDNISNYYDESLSDIHSRSDASFTLFRFLPSIDPFRYSETCLLLLLVWIAYLFIPRGYRAGRGPFGFGSYPKRYRWSARSRRRRRDKMFGSGSGDDNSMSYSPSRSSGGYYDNPSIMTPNTNNNNNESAVRKSFVSGINDSHVNNHNGLMTQPVDYFTPSPTAGGIKDIIINRNDPSYPAAPSTIASTAIPSSEVNLSRSSRFTDHGTTPNGSTPGNVSDSLTPHNNVNNTHNSSASTFQDEVIISTTMQRLRDEGGVPVTAHGSKGRPKPVILHLDEHSITWKTLPRRSSSSTPNSKQRPAKSHRVPLAHILYVDVGKQTTALRRLENASVPESHCLSLLTKEGSLDLEATDAGERDALVNCFSLVLDEVHAQDWRNVQRAPSTDVPSSFDEYDPIGSSDAVGTDVGIMTGINGDGGT